MSLNIIIEDHFGSKAKFARAIGISRWTIDDWLKDPSCIKVKHLQKISELSGISVEKVISQIHGVYTEG
jgi:hypothetical protein